MVHQEYTELPAVGRGKPGLSFYASWILLSMIAVPAAFVLSFIPLRFLVQFIGDFIVVNGVQHITEDYFSLYIFIPMMGLVTGLLQYLLLRSLLPRMGWWVAATAGGWIAGLVLLAFLIRLHLVNLGLAIAPAFVLMGIAIGAAQWLVLRLRLPGAGWWIVASLVGWGLLAAVTPGNALNQYGLITLGFFPACTTAAGLWFLMKRSGS